MASRLLPAFLPFFSFSRLAACGFGACSFHPEVICVFVFQALGKISAAVFSAAARKICLR
jgi:hypothetical protein